MLNILSNKLIRAVLKKEGVINQSFIPSKFTLIIFKRLECVRTYFGIKCLKIKDI